MSALANLVLSYNQLSGALGEAAFSGLASLFDLELHNNYFTSTLPAALASLSSCASLSFGYNRLTGTIPASIAEMPSLIGTAV